MAVNALRIVSDNAADRSTLTAGSAAITQLNLLTNSKSDVWRTAAATTSSSLTATWTSFEPVNMVALFGNLSPTATIQVLVYSDTAGTTNIYTGTATLCSPATAIKVAGLAAAQSVSAYGYGGGSVARIYLPATYQAKRVVINIVDTANLQGYLEAYRLVIGEYFEPTYGHEYGAELTMEDLSKSFRSDAGNLHTDVGAKYKRLTLNLAVLPDADRKVMWKIASYCGTSTPVFVSGYPDDADRDLEQAHTVFGKFSKSSVLMARDYRLYSMALELESV